MKRTKLIKIAMIVAITTTVASISFGCKANKDDNVTNNSSVINQGEDTEEKAVQDNKIEDSTEVIENESKAPVVASEEFTLYSKDVNTDEEVVLGTLAIDETKTVDEKLDMLAQQLSKDAFNVLPIKLVEITEVDGKKIAVFNLEEQGKNATESDYSKYEGTSWFNNHFQGSTGGNITKYTLNKTLLQADYTGEWVDGVKFLYKGEPIVFEHVESLGNINYR